MSAEQDFPDDLRLPDELAAYEARLAATPLAASTLGRDELLYRAGWAAAEAELARRAAATVVAAPLGTSRRVTAAWSAASAALAACLAVAITWSFAVRPTQAPTVANAPRISTGANESVGVAITSAADAASRRVASNLSLARVELAINRQSQIHRGVTPASLWSASRGPRLGAWDEPIIVSGEQLAAAPAIGVEHTSARELLDEMLPRAGRSSATEQGSPSSRMWEFFRPLTAGGDAI